tara:strand:+ start:119 stop:649 length:531 start_codon:yes stop_codon:yes gene_type:complete
MPPFASVSHPPATQPFVQPYYMKAKLLTAFEDSGTTPDPNPDFVKDMVEQFNGTNSNFGNWDSSNNYWLCPKTGTYKIYGQITFDARDNDRLHDARVILSVNDAQKAFSTLNLLTGNQGHDDDMDIASLNVTTILHITQNQQVKLKYRYVSDTATGVRIQGGGASDKTFLLIERIE